MDVISSIGNIITRCYSYSVLQNEGYNSGGAKAHLTKLLMNK